jgi:hypothetical protein
VDEYLETYLHDLHDIRRALTLDELIELMHMVRRIAALLLLHPALDANYQAAKAASHLWPKQSDSTNSG